MDWHLTTNLVFHSIIYLLGFVVLLLITGFKSFYMQQMQLQSKFNFAFLYLYWMISFLSYLLASLFLSQSLCLFVYWLLFNYKCCMLSEHAGVLVYVCMYVCGCLHVWLMCEIFCFLSICLFFFLFFCYFYLHRNWSFLNN